ncbi:MAG TPA: gamma-glutamylcyclotransferase [Caldisericia bacterium]|nr:gamma-glutamylcyclotransferase [Caldisericia bacterium]HQL66221.1 gamma-glutamylcyclotransferase [Caldisericia bacterium]
MTLYGGLFEIKKDDCNKLDRYEDYPCSYNRKKVIVKDDCGNSCKAIVYFRIGECKGKPSQEYRNIIIKDARDCGLPEDYIKNNL